MASRRAAGANRTRNENLDEIEAVQLSRRSRRSALVQLRFGRAAHWLSTIAAVLLALAAVIVFLFSYWDVIPEDISPWLENMKWFIPLLIGIIMASIVLFLKWEPFLADKTEFHFIASFIALIVPLSLIVMIILDSLGNIEVGIGIWVYPISFVGISISLVSLAMLWEGAGRRKLIAIISALLPMAIMTAPILLESDAITEILPLIFLGSAVCIQLSGSLLHLISTSTSVQQREILKGSDAKIQALRDELNMREERAEFREKALQEREIEAEALEKTLNDRNVEIEHRLMHAEKIEQELSAKEDQLLAGRNSLSALQREIVTMEEKLERRELEVSAREREQQSFRDSITEREKKLEDEMVKLRRERAQFDIIQRELEERERQLRNDRQAIDTIRETLVSEQNKLAERSKELLLKESSLDMKLRTAESSSGLYNQDSEQIDELKRWEEELLNREQSISSDRSQLLKHESMATELMKQAEHRLSNVEERAASLDVREKQLLENEIVLGNLEREISGGKMRLQEKMKEIETAREEITALKDQYNSFIERLEKRGEELAKKDELLERRLGAVDTRERKIKAMQERLKNEIDEIEIRRKELIQMEKSLSTKSSEMQVKEIELKERKKKLENMFYSDIVAPDATSGLIEEVKEREKILDVREKKLAEKERDLRKRAYELSQTKEQEIFEGEEIEQRSIDKPEKVSTGTKRLDDLLFGGLPFGSSVLLVGPPFSGKEVAVLTFLADGLKNGLPVIIITTSKRPEDIVKDFAPILPTFLEIEQLGLVRWIDATSGEASSRPRKSIVKVEGPDDFPGIIEAVEKFTEDVQNGHYPFFKLGYLSLSTSISHTEEMEDVKFIQAMMSRIRELGSSGMFALEKGMHSEQQMESIQHLMDGALLIKTEKKKTYFSIIGVGDVQTRDWIEFKHSNKGLNIGAFSLERIR